MKFTLKGMAVAIAYPELSQVAKYKEKRKEFPPFGVMYLAAFLEKYGAEVRLFKITTDNTSLNFRGFDAVGFSTPSSVTYPLVKKCRFESFYDRDALIMVGGVHASIFPGETLLDLDANVLCMGEGEITTLEILSEYKKRSFNKIKGIFYINDSGPIFTSSRPLIRNIDVLPFPARHLMDESDFIMTNRLSDVRVKMTHVMFSRGCPFCCRFCATPQKVVQYRSGRKIREELLLLKQDYGIEGFSIVDDNSIINKENLRDICDSIADLDLKWITLSRVDTIDSDILKRMKNSGCIEIAFGLESGSEKILKLMKKGITPEQIKKAILTTYSIGLKVKIFLIHGFPGENKETTSETLELLREVAPMIHRISLFRFVPLPGSYVYRNRSKFRLRINDEEYRSVDWSKYSIHHNNYHWWGTERDFKAMNEAYQELSTFVEENWQSF